MSPVLADVIKYFDTEIVHHDDKVPFIIVISKIEVGYNFLKNLLEIDNDHMRKMLKIRLKGRDPATQTIIDKLLKKKKTTF